MLRNNSVALRKESVDRNSAHARAAFCAQVALRKESVDRNALSLLIYHLKYGSLSARRAWIEIMIDEIQLEFNSVALRKESVDRNYAKPTPPQKTTVALRKESVDRNIVSVICLNCSSMSLSARRAWIEIWSAVLTELLILCRSPQGERG